MTKIQLRTCFFLLRCLNKQIIREKRGKEEEKERERTQPSPQWKKLAKRQTNKQNRHSRKNLSLKNKQRTIFWGILFV